MLSSAICPHPGHKPKGFGSRVLVTPIIGWWTPVACPFGITPAVWYVRLSLLVKLFRHVELSNEVWRGDALQDLCDAALRFAFDTLRVGGHFVCKFYQGGEDKALELRLKLLFAKVHREKPESSRSVWQDLLGTPVQVCWYALLGVERSLLRRFAEKARYGEESRVCWRSMMIHPLKRRYPKTGHNLLQETCLLHRYFILYCALLGYSNQNAAILGFKF